MKHRITAFLIAAALVALLPVAACDDADQVPEPGSDTITAQAAATPEDRAAQLAAQTQLRNAQTAQEAYYADNQEYASTSQELKTVDPRLSSRVDVVSGSAAGYEMNVTASDSARTVYTIRKTASRVERVDSNGNSW